MFELMTGKKINNAEFLMRVLLIVKKRDAENFATTPVHIFSNFAASYEEIFDALTSLKKDGLIKQKGKNRGESTHFVLSATDWKKNTHQHWTLGGDMGG